MKRLRLICPEPENFSPLGLEFARTHFDATIGSMDREAFVTAAPHHEVALVRFSTRIDSTVLRRGSSLLAILSPTTGLDHVDLNAAHRHGVEVFHLCGQRRFLQALSSTAEHTFALILAVARKLPAAVQDVAAGNWRQAPYQGLELSGRTLGLVGAGRLGSKVARMGIAFGMHVLAYDTRRVRLPHGVERTSTLRDLLRQSDVLSLHAPLNEQTKGLIGAHELSLLPHGAIVINTARGGLIDEDALVHALCNGSVAGAGLDVLCEEPPRTGHSRMLVQLAPSHPRLIISPHIGGACVEAIEKADLFILRRFLQACPKLLRSPVK